MKYKIKETDFYSNDDDEERESCPASVRRFIGKGPSAAQRVANRSLVIPALIARMPDFFIAHARVPLCNFRTTEISIYTNKSAPRRQRATLPLHANFETLTAFRILFGNVYDLSIVSKNSIIFDKPEFSRDSFN